MSKIEESLTSKYGLHVSSKDFVTSLKFTKGCLTSKEEIFKIYRFITSVLEEASLMSLSLNKSMKVILDFLY